MGELGQRERARQWAARALRIDPNDPAVLYNVGCTYAQLGDSDDAIDCLEKSVGAGWGQKDWIRNDPDLNSLREIVRLKELLERL